MQLLSEAKQAAEETLADPAYVSDPTFPAMRERMSNLFGEEGNIFN